MVQAVGVDEEGRVVVLRGDRAGGERISCRNGGVRRPIPDKLLLSSGEMRWRQA